MNIAAIDAQLTTQLVLFNGGLNFDNAQDLMEAIFSAAFDHLNRLSA